MGNHTTLERPISCVLIKNYIYHKEDIISEDKATMARVK